MIPKTTASIFGFAVAALVSTQLAAQAPAMPMQINYENSAEFGWMSKRVLASRTVEPMTTPANWVFQGTGKLSFLTESSAAGRPALRVDMDMFTDKPAPTRSGLSSVNLKRPFAGEDWTAYNRISFWIRPQVSGFPMLPIQIVLHNDGQVKVPDVYNSEGTHYVTLQNNKWQQVVWEIEPLARDRVTAIEIGYWVNKMLAQPGDRVAFEIGRLELQRVEPDHHKGWNVAPGRSRSATPATRPAASKTALASDLTARNFRLLRVGDTAARRSRAREAGNQRVDATGQISADGFLRGEDARQAT